MNSGERPHILLREHPPPTDREYAGGGGGTYPRTSYERHARKIFKQAEQLRAMFAKLHPAGLEIGKGYFRLELPSSQSITGSGGRRIEDDIHSSIVGSPNVNIGHFSASAESFSLLVEELQRYAETPDNVGKSKFAAIEQLGSIPLKEKLGPGVADRLATGTKSVDVLLGLFPDLLDRERQAVRMAVEALLRPTGGRVMDEIVGEGGSYLRVEAGPDAIRTIAESIIAVQSVDQTEEVVELSSRPGPIIDSGVVLRPSDRAPIVCVIDTGVAEGCRFIDPFVIAREHPLGPPHLQDHGTFVASRALFGDTIRDQLSAGALDNRVRIVSVSAFTRDSIGNKISPTTDQLMRIVRDTVTRWHERVRVFNLSMNLAPKDGSPDFSVENVVSPLAAEIDALSRRFGVLFVISSGNYPSHGEATPTEAYPDYFKDPKTRVLSPAEAMLAITVGSYAARDNSGSMVSKGFPSPFTRRGPGIGKYRKPDLVANGGNYGVGWREQDDLSVAGLASTSAVAYGCGTSFAAPVVASLAAQIMDAVPNATAELVRAMLVHFADLMPEAESSEIFSNLVGNGRLNPAPILRSTPWEQTYAFMGSLGYRKILRIPFFVPRGLTSRTIRDRLRVRCTIAFAPETNRTLRSGYCKSHLRCKLIKLTPGNAEKEVTDQGDSPSAIKDRYSSIVRLEKTFSSNVESGDWQLLVEQESRWRLKDPNTPISVLITVEDPHRASGIDIYSMIRTEARGRYMAELTVRQQLRT